MKIFKLSLAVILFINLAGCGISAGGLKNDPGYAVFDYPHFWEADKEVSISLGPTLMGIVRNVLDEEEEVYPLIKDVKGLHLRVYNIDDNVAAVATYVDDSAERLDALGWERLVSVKDEEEHVAVMIKMDAEEIQGMVVLTANSTEAVFINVIGSIQPEALQPLIAQVYSDVPDAVTTL